MIIKIACRDDESSWRYYEGDRVQSAFEPLKYWIDVFGGDVKLVNGPNIHEDWLVSEQCMQQKDDDPLFSVALISFVSKDGTENNIYTDRKVYLMTEQGDTIERLN